HRVVRARPERIAIAQRRQQELAIGQRRRVQLVAAADEDLEPGRLGPARGQLVVKPDADAAVFDAAPLQAERAANRRLEAVGADDQTGPAQLAADAQADGATALDGGALDGRLLEH